ncbi:MAG TPA: CE1759 family FMN reductase [Mycobacteriales bacterium]|nr:CE1759 family FMN reductase [Mycobacteriales bacterium]
MTRIAVLSAGVSTPSSTRLLADRLAAAAGAAVPGAVIEVIELRSLARELADAVVTGFPAGALAEAVRAVETADAVIAVTPVFAASYSGLFKMFVDVLDPDALRGTPVLLAATAGSARHSLVLEHAMRPLFSYLRALTVPTAVFAASEDWAGATPLAERIDRATAELAGLLDGRRPARKPTLSFEDLLAG